MVVQGARTNLVLSLCFDYKLHFFQGDSELNHKKTVIIPNTVLVILCERSQTLLEQLTTPGTHTSNWKISSLFTNGW